MTNGQDAPQPYGEDGDSLPVSDVRLAVSEESLRLSNEAGEIGIWDLDLGTDRLTWSDRTKAMFGISPGVPCSMADFYAGLHDEDRDAVGAAFAASIDPARRADYDVQYRTIGREDGVVRWVAAKGRALFDAQGRCVRAIGTAIDITSRKQVEVRRLALVELGERIRERDDPTDLAYDAAEILGRALGVSRAGYGSVDPRAETIVIARDWSAAGVAPLAGVLKFRDYGSYIEDLLRGRTVAIEDAREDKRTQATAAALEAVAARALLNLPVVEAGQVVAMLYVGHAMPRVWLAEELAFIREVADRTRMAVARLTAEAELRASEAKFEAITNSIDQMIWSTRPDGFHDYYNDRWYQYTGVSHGSVDGAGWSALFHPDDQERAWSLWRHSLATGAPYHIEYRLRHHSGQYRWVLGRAQPVRDPGGRIVRWYGSCTDVHDMVAAREVVARSRAELEVLVQARTEERNRLWRMTNMLVAVIGLDSTLREVNPAWPAVLGWSEAELVGRSHIDFMHPEDVALSRNWPGSQVKGEPAAEVRNRYRTKDGDYRTIAWSITTEDGVFHAIGRDVTGEAQQAAALEIAEEALRQAQKMEAVGQLTGGIAHDFNNMLAVVIGSLELLSRRIDQSDARARRYVASAAEGARRAAVLTQRLLAFSRQQPLKPAVVDANALVSGMSELIRGSIGGEIRLETVLASGLWRIHADPNQLESVLLNLAVNARDAMPQGGRLTIETQNAHLDARYAYDHPGLACGQYVMIAVSDTGAGMPASVSARAFEPFFTTKPVGKGTGLGLSQVYGFVKQSGGHVKISSELGEGTSVKVYLPRLVASEPAGEAAAPAAALAGGEGHELILVVEDEAAVRQFSVEALRELGYQVIEADGAARALRLLDEYSQVALLFTDVIMPEVNGPRLAEAACALRPALKVLFTTGYTGNAVVHNGMPGPEVPLLGKPFTLEELASSVRAVLDA
jgi:PAS domain S-box-containing protein